MTDNAPFLSFHQWLALSKDGHQALVDAGVHRETASGAMANERTARRSYKQYARDYEDRTGILVTPRDSRPAFQFGLILAGFALAALLPMPAWYYELLRSVLSVGSVFVCVLAFRSLQFWWLPLPVIVVAIWTPSPWFALDRAAWVLLDIGVAAAFVLSALLIPSPRQTHDDRGKPIRYSQWWKFGIGAAVVTLFLFGMVQQGAENRAFCAEMDGEGLPCDLD